MMRVEYRGKVSEDFMRKLKKLLSGPSFYFCTAKLRSQVCQLKTHVPYVYKSKVVYKITCAACSGAYIGQTVRHFATRLKENGMKSDPVFKHFQARIEELTADHARILDTVSDSKSLLALEAVYIRGLKGHFAETQFAERERQFADFFSANCPFDFAEICRDNLPNT